MSSEMFHESMYASSTTSSCIQRSSSTSWDRGSHPDKEAMLVLVLALPASSSTSKLCKVRSRFYNDAAMRIVAVISASIPSDSLISRRRLRTYVFPVPADPCTKNVILECLVSLAALVVDEMSHAGCQRLVLDECLRLRTVTATLMHFTSSARLE